jgi:hypothetical protein
VMTQPRCRSEIALFAHDHGAARYPDPYWANTAPGEWKFKASLPVVRQVPVTVYYSDAAVAGRTCAAPTGYTPPSPPPGAPDCVVFAIAEANRAFEAFLAGFTLVPKYVRLIDGTKEASRLIPPSSSKGVCDSAQVIRHTPALYQRGVINVYFSADAYAATYGHDCVEVGAQDVVFVYRDAKLATLAHEVGHALGLWTPKWGHPSAFTTSPPPTPPWPAGNLMMSNVDAVTDISLGQLYRMNFDARSLLSRQPGILGGTNLSMILVKPHVLVTSLQRANVVCQSDEGVERYFCPYQVLR